MKYGRLNQKDSISTLVWPLLLAHPEQQVRLMKFTSKPDYREGKVLMYLSYNPTRISLPILRSLLETPKGTEFDGQGYEYDATAFGLTNEMNMISYGYETCDIRSCDTLNCSRGNDSLKTFDDAIANLSFSLKSQFEKAKANDGRSVAMMSSDGGGYVRAYYPILERQRDRIRPSEVLFRRTYIPKAN